MKNFSLVFLIAGLVLPGMVRAANWQPIDGAVGIEVHVDPNTVASAGGGINKAWVMHSYSEIQKSRGYPLFQYQSSIQLYLVNCAERTSGILQDAFYVGEYGTGATVESNTYSRKNVVFSDVIPGTLGEGTLEYICGVVKRKSKR